MATPLPRRRPTTLARQTVILDHLEHRTSPEFFQVAMGDSLSGVEAPAAEVMGPCVEAGATWWLEGIGWPRRPRGFWPEYVSAGAPSLD